MQIRIADPRRGEEFQFNGLSILEAGLLIVDAVAFDWEPYAHVVDAILRASAETVHVVYAPWKPRQAKIHAEFQRLVGDCQLVGFNYTVQLRTASFELERLLRCRCALGDKRSGVWVVVGYEQGASHELDLVRRPLGGSAASWIVQESAGLSCAFLLDEMEMTTLFLRPNVSNCEPTNSLLDSLRSLPTCSPPPYRRNPVTGLAE